MVRQIRCDLIFIVGHIMTRKNWTQIECDKKK